MQQISTGLVGRFDGIPQVKIAGGRRTYLKETKTC